MAENLSALQSYHIWYKNLLWTSHTSHPLPPPPSPPPTHHLCRELVEAGLVVLSLQLHLLLHLLHQLFSLSEASPLQLRLNPGEDTTFSRWKSVYYACITKQVLGSIVVSISACHAEDPGSIPGRGVFVSTFLPHHSLNFSSL